MEKILSTKPLPTIENILSTKPLFYLDFPPFSTPSPTALSFSRSRAYILGLVFDNTPHQHSPQ
jgi:hypothetical protein